MWLIALASSALAGPTGYYHPFDLGQASDLFREASNSAVLGMETQTRKSILMSRSLQTYRQSLDLLGDRATDEERERLESLETEYNREFAVLQAFADTMIEDVQTEFEAAVSRAIATLEATAVECEREIPDGPRVPGMRGRTKPNPDCKGEDLNAALASAIDADATLQVAVQEIASLTWPEITIPTTAIDPLGGPRYLDVRDFFATGARDALAAIDRADDDARMVFEAAIEEGEDLTLHVEAAQKITAQTAASRAALAAPVLVALDGVLAKWVGKGEMPTGWCANPAALGGCTGDLAQADLSERLWAEKKVQKALP